MPAERRPGPLIPRANLFRIPELTAPDIRAAFPHLLTVVLAAFALYAFTAPRTVALEDDGEFVAMAYYLGVPHPPGYPLYVLLAKPFTWLPVGSIAYRVHLASGFYGAATCAALWWVARTLTLDIAACYLGALAYAVSRVFWSQAIIAEVYTMNTLVFFVLLAQSLAYAHDRRASRLDLIALVYALGLCNHWPLVIVASPCLLLILLSAGGTLPRDALARLPRLVAMAAIGLLPYAWMVMRSQTAPALSFYGAIETWHDFWYYVHRSGYAWLEQDIPRARTEDLVDFLRFMLHECAWQFTPAGAVLAAAGFAAQWRRWGFLISTALAGAFFGSIVPLFTLINGEYDFLSQIALKVFPLVAYGILALWIALAVSEALRYLRARGPAWSGIGYAAGVALVIATLLTNLRMNHRSDYAFAKDYAVTLLNNFPPAATVITAGDADTFALAYFHFVEGIRPDIRLQNIYGVGIGLDGRLFDPVKLTWQQKVAALTAFAQKHDGPLYFFDQSPPSLDDEDFGIYYKVGRSTGGQRTFRIDPTLISLFRRIAADRSETDGMTIVQRDLTMAQIARVLTPLVDQNGAEPSPVYATDLELATEQSGAMLERVSYLSRYRKTSDEQVLALIAKAEANLQPTTRRWSQAGLYLVKGRVLARLGRTQEAIEALRSSLAIQPSPKNEAHRDLAALGVSAP